MDPISALTTSMEPTDGTAMMQQTAQFTTVETLQAIAETQEQLMGFQQVTLALSYVSRLLEQFPDALLLKTPILKSCNTGTAPVSITATCRFNQGLTGSLGIRMEACNSASPSPVWTTAAPPSCCAR